MELDFMARTIEMKGNSFITGGKGGNGEVVLDGLSQRHGMSWIFENKSNNHLSDLRFLCFLL
jgi:hypothetical protein